MMGFGTGVGGPANSDKGVVPTVAWPVGPTLNKVIVMGTSLGGFHALQTVLGELPKEFQLPIVVVQHRSFEDSDAFSPLLASYVQLPVVEAEDKQEILPLEKIGAFLIELAVGQRMKA